MGTGYTLGCRKCGYRIEGFLGIGFGFPKVYAELMTAGREGKLGERIKTFLEEHPDGVLNTDKVFLQCAACGTLEVDYDLSMYVRNPEVPRRDWGRWSVAAPYIEADYVSPVELKCEKTYELFAPGHICDKCGKPMKSFSDDALRKNVDVAGEKQGLTDVVCPECRAPLFVEDVLMWD